MLQPLTEKYPVLLPGTWLEMCYILVKKKKKHTFFCHYKLGWKYPNFSLKNIHFCH